MQACPKKSLCVYFFLTVVLSGKDAPPWKLAVAGSMGKYWIYS
jgi:hypothetical protein